MAILVFLTAFCSYLATMRGFSGYEPETAAATQGLVETGKPVILRGSPLAAQGRPGEDGKLIARAGLPSVAVKVPFYVVGDVLDDLATSRATVEWRLRGFWASNAFVVALAAAVFFLLVLRLARSRSWAIVMAGVFAFASLAWPYSKVGMETVVMLGVMLAAYGAVATLETRKTWPWIVAGFGAGMAICDKPYAMFVLVPLIWVGWPALRAADRASRIRWLLALAVPLALWALAFFWYNEVRTGSVLDTGRNDADPTYAAPLNAFGFLLSPGKGLVFYSPLVVLGLLGAKAFYREHRRVAITLLMTALLGLAFSSTLRFWSDETWGPRYIVYVAWIPLIPLPWFAVSSARRRLVAAVAILAVAIQMLAVAGPPNAIAYATRDLTGQPIFQRVPGKSLITPFGRDPIRWIPEISPLLFQSEMFVSKAAMALGAPPITVTYQPYEGPVRKVTLDQPILTKYGFDVVNFWWLGPEAQSGTWAGPLFLVLGALGVAALWVVARAKTGGRMASSRPDVATST